MHEWFFERELQKVPIIHCRIQVYMKKCSFRHLDKVGGRVNTRTERRSADLRNDLKDFCLIDYSLC